MASNEQNQQDGDRDQADAASAAEAGEAESAETVTLPKAEIEALRLEIRELKERQLRAQADFDNTRKRLRKDVDEAGNRAIVRFVRPVLVELDNFDRALAAATPESFAEFASGVSMIHDNLGKVLASSGIEAVVDQGVFDPSIHEVIAELERADVPKGTIVEVHRRGYRLKDQLIRAAQVVVAKAPVAP